MRYRKEWWEMENPTYMFTISWVYETDDEIIEDIENIFACFEEDALEKFYEVEDIPEDAKIVEISKSEFY